MVRRMIAGGLAACVAGLTACAVCPRRAPAPVGPVVVSSLPPQVYLLADPTVLAESLLGMRVRASAAGHVVLLDARPGLREGTQLRRASDATLPPTLTRAGWLAYRGRSDAEVVARSHELRDHESLVEYEVSDVERITLVGASSSDDPIVEAVLVGTVRTRCPPIGSTRCEPTTFEDAAIAIVVGGSGEPWAELALDEDADDPPRVLADEPLAFSIGALPGTDLVLRARDADGTARTLWRASAVPDPEHRGAVPPTTRPIAPLHRAIVMLPPAKAPAPRCVRLELDVIAPSRNDLDPRIDAVAWDRFVASLPPTRKRTITRDVIVVPDGAAAHSLDAVCLQPSP